MKSGVGGGMGRGRNEGGGQRFHAWVDALIEAPDDELPKVFASVIGPEVK